jgi:hypothetical protein
MKGFDKFQRAYLRVGVKDFQRWLESKENSKLLNEEIRKHLFDLGPPTPPRPPNTHTGREAFFRKLSIGFNEIVTSRDALRDIEYYIGRFPYRTTRILKHSYLQFHVEAFFHEIYILDLRLLNYLTLMERQYRDDPRLPAIRDLCALVRQVVSNALDKHIQSRGSHVHQYRMWDIHIDRLGSIHLHGSVRDRKLKRLFKAFYEVEYRKCRRRWRKWMAELNASIAKLLDVFFGSIYAITFNKNGTVRYPSRLKF